jgi:hypothetical protein
LWRRIVIVLALAAPAVAVAVAWGWGALGVYLFIAAVAGAVAYAADVGGEWLSGTSRGRSTGRTPTLDSPARDRAPSRFPRS